MKKNTIFILIIMLFTLSIAQAQVTYHLGNSLTDTKNGMLEPLSESAGYNHTYYRSTVPGAPTDWIWEHPDGNFGEPDYRVVFDTKGPIEHLFTQPFAGHDRSIENEADYSGRFFNLAKQKSPNVQHWLYMQWPDINFSDNWSKGTGSASGLGLTLATSWEKAVCNHAAYHEAVRNLMDTQTDGKQILIVPAGLGLAKLKIEIESGRVPGITNFFQSQFSDDLHLSGNGAYMVNLVHYACIYKESPVGKVTYKPSSLTEEQANIYKQIAWDVASDYPWSGLNGSGSLRNDICSVDSEPGNTTVGIGVGIVKSERWTGIGGVGVDQIPTSTPPAEISILDRLEIPLNSSDNYGTRISGYIRSTADGYYTFYIAGDDNAELWLSSGPNPADKARVAHVPGWTNSHEWQKYPEQKSQQVYLVKGGKFYFEILHKEAGGGDNVAVGWTGPGISSITVLEGENIEYFGELESLWGDATATAWAENQSTELGTKFQPNVAGRILGIRVYATAQESGNHTATIWRNSDNTIIGGPYTINYGGTEGWLTYNLPTPIMIASGTEYTVVVSTGTDAGKYLPHSSTGGTSAGSNNKNLTYPANAGVYTHTIGARPTQSNGNNYLRDIVFEATEVASNVCGEINNAGFESDLSQWTNTANTTITSDARSGFKAALIDLEGGLHYGSLIPVAAYQTVTFNVSAKATNNPLWSGVGIDYLDASGNEIGQFIHEITASTYTDYTYTGNTPENTTHIRLWIWKTWDDGELFVDNVCITKGAINDPDPDPNPNPNPYAGKMGVNLVMDMAFVNVIDEGLRADGVTSYDAQGWPQSDFTAVFDWRLVAEWAGGADDPEQFRINMHGTYKCGFEGQADVTSGWVQIQNKLYDEGTNRTTFEVVVPATNNGRVFWDMRFSNTKRSPSSTVGSGITKLKVMRPGYDLNTTKVFNDAYVNLCKSASFASYRFYNVNNVWDGVPQYPQNTTWANRKLPSDASQANMLGINGKSEGWSWEYIIQLANELNRDIWICIHISADDDYVKQLATKLKNELNPGINIYVEVGNEVWAPGWHVQDNWLDAQAKELGIDFNHAYARNVVRVSDLFKEIYGASAINNKIRVVLGAQQGWMGRTTDYHLPYIKSTFGEPRDYIYAISPSTYFGGTGPTIEEAINNCHTSVMIEYDDPSDQPSLAAFLKVATDYGFPGKCVSYEGGEHAHIGDVSNLGVEIGKHRDARMATEYYTQYKSFFDHGGSLACQFTIFSSYNRYGSWGLTDDVNNADRNYKFKAMRNLTGDPNGMPIPETPASPGNLTVAVQGISATLNWSDNASNEEGYEVWFKEASDTTWKYLSTVGPDKSSYRAGAPALVLNTTYNFRVRAYNFSKWSGFSNEVAATTTALPTTCSNGNGLRADYYNTSNWNLTTPSYSEDVANINFDWGAGSPNPLVTADSFAVKYTGFIQPEFTDVYTFNVQSNWASQLWINGQQIIASWWGDNLNSTPISLNAGEVYSIELRYQHSYQTWSADAKVKLSWSTTAMVTEVVPQCRLFRNSPAGGQAIQALADSQEEESGVQGYEVYPNPASETTTIKFDGVPGEPVEVQILNSLYAPVKKVVETAEGSDTLISIDTKDLLPGMYLVKIRKGNKQVTKKLIIAK